MFAAASTILISVPLATIWAMLDVGGQAMALVRVVKRGAGSVLGLVVPWLSLGANQVVVVITSGTLRLLVDGRLLRPAAEVTR